MKLVIMRHAECEKNRVGIPGGKGANLTSEGATQAEEAAHVLSAYGIDIVFACPVTQAIQTGEIVAKSLQIPIAISSELSSIHLGVLSGIPIKEAFEKYPASSASMQLWRDGLLEISELEIEGMEDPDKFLMRGVEFILENADHPDRVVLVVCPTSVLILFTHLKNHVNTQPGFGYRALDFTFVAPLALEFGKADLDWLRREKARIEMSGFPRHAPCKGA